MTYEQICDEYHATRVKCTLEGRPMVLELTTPSGKGDIHEIKGGVFGAYLADAVYVDGVMFKNRGGSIYVPGSDTEKRFIGR